MRVEGLNLRPYPRLVRKHRKLLIALACLAVIAGVIAILARDQEPTYNGRPLHYWTYLYTANRFGWPHPEASHGSIRNAEASEAAEAVRAIGPAAVPYFVKWIGYEPNPTRTKIAGFMRRFRKGPLTRLIPDGNSPDQAWLRAVSASDGLKILGPDASSASPQLLRLALRSRNPAGAQQIVEALAGLGPQGVLALAKILTNPPAKSASEAGAHARSTAIFLLTNMGANALPAMPALVKCLTDGDKQVAMQADGAVRSIVVTVVSENLSGLDGRARRVTPPVVALLNDAAPQIREHTTNAILEIAPEVLTNAPAK